MNANIVHQTDPISHDVIRTHAYENGRTRCGQAVNNSQAWTPRQVKRSVRDLYVTCIKCGSN